MNASPPIAVNHHAGHPGFAGPTGLLAGLVMLVGQRARARLPLDLANVTPTDHVVDIGCGPGSAVRGAARRGARATGVDPAPVMLWLARIVTPDRLGVTWSQGTAEAVPLPDGSATIAWSIATVHHWKDVTAGLAEMRRVLAPGGRFLAIERQTRAGATGLASHGWTQQQAQSFAAECRDAGFDRVGTQPHTTGRHAVWVVKALQPAARNENPTH